MSDLRFWSVLLVILIVAVQVASIRVEAWSEVVYTNPWTEPETTDAEEQPATEMVEDSKPKESVEIPESLQSPDIPTIDDNLLDFENLHGTWYIWTPGTAVNIHDQGSGEYVAHKYVQGADQGIIVVNEDSTYSMSHAAWAKDETVSGTWRLSYPREINGEVLQAIVLVDGITNVDWAVAPAPNGKIRLLWAMGWADGSATWVFDSELIRP